MEGSVHSEWCCRIYLDRRAPLGRDVSGAHHIAKVHTCVFVERCIVITGKQYGIYSCPHSENHVVAVKMKNTAQSLFRPVFLLTLPSLALCFLSLFISLLCLSLSTLIAICAIIMAHHWEFDWCLSDSNKQGWCRGMLSRWEKIKQIRDHILWLVRTAFVEWILQDAEKSTQHPWEWK